MKSLEESKLSSKWGVYKEYKLNRSRGIETGIKCLDDYLKGLGGLVNIQGETSSCKSVLGLQIVHHNAVQGRPCIIIDKENGDGRIIDRLLCQTSGLSLKQLESLSDADKLRYKRQIDALPIHLHTEPILGLPDLKAQVDKLWDMYQRPMTLLYDSIQAGDKIAVDPRLSLEDWVYGLDRLKLEYQGNLTIIFISEKNRASYGFQGVGSGKGSNVVDYKPETVLDISWQEEFPNTFMLKVGKHRDGLRGAQFTLSKTMAVQSDNRSFCFKLQEDSGYAESSLP